MKLKTLLFTLLFIPVFASAVVNPTGKTHTTPETTLCADGKRWLVCAPGNEPGIRSFPGAQGLAALTRGAFDATCDGTRSVYAVTNLNDSGAGSLRDAIDGIGKACRIVVFNTSGIIDLATPIQVLSSNISILGQTSPSGISTSGNMVSIGNSDNEGVGNIIIRHMRFRAGSHGGAADPDMEAFRCWSCNNLMIDHSSFAWGADETVSITTYNEVEPAYNITFSRSIIAEGLTDPAPEANHGYGLLFNGTAGTGGTNSIDIHNSFFAHHNDRMPQLSGAIEANIVNNVLYNPYGSQGAKVVPYASRSGELKVNYEGNYVIPGPDSNAAIRDAGNLTEITLSNDASGVTPWPMLYMSDNYGVERLADSDPEWQLSNWWSGVLAPTSWQSNTRFNITGGVGIAIVDLTAATLTSFRDSVLDDVGATMPVRDSLDTALVSDAKNGTGSLRADVTYPTDWPTYGSASVPADTDNDNMADSWETANGLNVGVNDAFDDFDSDGYLNIEEYHHYLAGD